MNAREQELVAKIRELECMAQVSPDALARLPRETRAAHIERFFALYMEVDSTVRDHAKLWAFRRGLFWGGAVTSVAWSILGIIIWAVF